MTLKQVLQAIRIELNKQKAPELSLVEFNYIINKAVTLYCNLTYNSIEMNQQSTDDSRVLKSTVKLKPVKLESELNGWLDESSDMMEDFSNLQALQSGTGVKYEVNLPIDYLHLLNCICVFQANKPYDCYPKGSILTSKASRLTADLWGMVLDNVFNRPCVDLPYYYIHNVNSNTATSTNPVYADTTSITSGNDMVGKPTNNLADAYKVLSNGFYVTEYKDPATNKKFIQVSSTGALPEDSLWFYYEGFNPNDSSTWNKINSGINYDSVNKVFTNGRQVLLSLADKSAGAEYVKAKFIYPEASQTIRHEASLMGEGTSNFPRTFKMDLDGDGKADTNVSLVHKPTASRLGNISPVRMEIRVDSDDIFELKQVLVDYMKVPQELRLTQELLMLHADTSQMMEFPEYVNKEIINIAVKLIMERNMDLRLQTHIPVNQSIAPAQAATQQLQAAK